MKDYLWKVVPLCEKQLRDVNPKDILNNGLYRKCNIYKGGGGYDKFEDIYKKRNNLNKEEKFNNQFVVQLFGCPLRCPYCYVTNDGIFGNYKEISTSQLVKDFNQSKLDVFHLMGGAPALYIEHWIEILEKLPQNIPFHSDLLCIEKEYDINILKELAKFKNSLYAISIKGATNEEFKNNTRKALNKEMFWENIKKINESKLPVYFTFTGMNNSSINYFKKELKEKFPTDYENLLKDSFDIKLVKYKALESVAL